VIVQRVSVVLPAFNEAGNIVDLIRGVATVIPEAYTYEIIVVDDNSADGTYRLVCDTFADEPRVRAILRTLDRGLAKSIRAGIEQVSGDYVVVMDTDFTHDPKEIPNLLHVVKICDIASGSRFCAGGRMSDTQHYLISLAYNWMLRIVLRTQIQDNSGGFFVARRDALFSLPFDEIFFGYGDYFFRLLHFAQKARLKIIEIPAEYLARSHGQSKSHWLSMFVGYTRAAVRLRLRMTRIGRDQAGKS
jgi:dolichol-phosphate mannosyltransferase